MAATENAEAVTADRIVEETIELTGELLSVGPRFILLRPTDERRLAVNVDRIVFFEADSDGFVYVHLQGGPNLLVEDDFDELVRTLNGETDE